MSLLDAIKRGFILDGAMGTELIKYGHKAKTELLNVTDSDIVTAVHKSYVDAGSDAVCTNTFSCNRRKADLSHYSLEELIAGAVKAAKNSGAKYVLYDCGPTGELFVPHGRLSFDDGYEIFAEQAIFAQKYGCDGAIIETMGDLKELRCALLAFKENTDLPILCSMTFEETGRTFLGTDAECFVLTAQSLGAAAVGLNCGTGPDKALPILKRMAQVNKVPLFAKPNAGLPKFIGGQTVYDMDTETFAHYVKEIQNIGINILGGCCGTTPEFIKAVSLGYQPTETSISKIDFDGINSYAMKAAFGEKTLVIGERVNPTNRPLLKQALRDRDYDHVMGLCVEQRDAGADILDINCGLPGEDEAAILSDVINYSQGVATLPFCIDTSKKDALEMALRNYDGVALINSVNGEEESINKVLPLAKKYSSYVVALCLDKDGIPKTAQKRVEIAEYIAKRAAEYGVEKKKLLIDPLTMAISVDDNNGKILIETLQELHKRGFKTVIGLSNISFGLPARHKLNGALLHVAKEIGVTAVIINPSLKANDEKESIELLYGRDPSCKKYIEKYADLPKEVEKKTVLSVRECVAKGLTAEGMSKLKEIFDGTNGDDIVDNQIIAGLNDLGEAYERGFVFLPGLIAGSETAKAMLDYVKAGQEGKSADKATVLIATVKGDVHDIGKNIVKTVAGNYGYRMIDLGKDVSTDAILEAIDKYHPQGVALSALMTTTLDNMTETAAAIKKNYPDVKILVGGAVVSYEYAEKIGAYYSKDAREACLTMERIF